MYIYGDLMPKKVISLSIDEGVYEAYRKLCEEKGWIMSKQVELFMKREVIRWEKNGKE